MEELDFTQNWNGKLFLEHFSTCRLHNTDKYQVGKLLKITMRGVVLGNAEVVAVRTAKVAKFTDVLAYIDTGRHLAYMLTILKNMYSGLTEQTEMDHVVLRWKVRNMPTFNQLIKQWHDELMNKNAQTYITF